MNCPFCKVSPDLCIVGRTHNMRPGDARVHKMHNWKQFLCASRTFSFLFCFFSCYFFSLRWCSLGSTSAWHVTSTTTQPQQLERNNWCAQFEFYVVWSLSPSDVGSPPRSYQLVRGVLGYKSALNGGTIWVNVL